MESPWIEVKIPSKKKTVSTFAAISKRWPREVVKLSVNVRFFSGLKKLHLTLKEKSKKKCQNIKTNCSI